MSPSAPGHLHQCSVLLLTAGSWGQEWGAGAEKLRLQLELPELVQSVVLPACGDERPCCVDPDVPMNFSTTQLK